MLHKISELCKKIDVIKALSLTLYNMKYVDKNASREQIDDLIEEITCASGWCIKSIDYRTILS